MAKYVNCAINMEQITNLTVVWNTCLKFCYNLLLRKLLTIEIQSETCYNRIAICKLKGSCIYESI